METQTMFIKVSSNIISHLGLIMGYLSTPHHYSVSTNVSKQNTNPKEDLYWFTVGMLDIANYVQKTYYLHLTNTIISLEIYSAGVGRTGTFITIDMVLQQIENEGIIDIPKIINGLRQQRMKMVQTPVSMIIY